MARSKVEREAAYSQAGFLGEKVEEMKSKLERLKEKKYALENEKEAVDDKRQRVWSGLVKKQRNWPVRSGEEQTASKKEIELIKLKKKQSRKIRNLEKEIRDLEKEIKDYERNINRLTHWTKDWEGEYV
jgi:hypothetical protein